MYNVWLIHFAIQQELTQHCKATVLQYKVNNLKDTLYPLIELLWTTLAVGLQTRHLHDGHLLIQKRGERCCFFPPGLRWRFLAVPFSGLGLFLTCPYIGEPTLYMESHAKFSTLSVWVFYPISSEVHTVIVHFTVSGIFGSIKCSGFELW